MQTNTNNLNRGNYYRQPALTGRPDYSNGAEAVEAEDQINLSIRIPLPNINRRHLLKGSRKLLITLAVSAVSLFVLYKILWFVFNHST
jgi:uncharacterized membrane protein